MGQNGFYVRSVTAMEIVLSPPPCLPPLRIQPVERVELEDNATAIIPCGMRIGTPHPFLSRPI